MCPCSFSSLPGRAHLVPATRPRAPCGAQSYGKSWALQALPGGFYLSPAALPWTHQASVSSVTSCLALKALIQPGLPQEDSLGTPTELGLLPRPDHSPCHDCPIGPHPAKSPSHHAGAGPQGWPPRVEGGTNPPEMQAMLHMTTPEHRSWPLQQGQLISFIKKPTKNEQTPENQSFGK